MCILQKYITRGLEFIAAKISQSCFLSEASGRETIGGEAERKKERGPIITGSFCSFFLPLYISSRVPLETL